MKCSSCIYNEVCMYKGNCEALESEVNALLESNAESGYNKELSAFDVEITCKKYKKIVTRKKRGE